MESMYPVNFYLGMAIMLSYSEVAEVFSIVRFENITSAIKGTKKILQSLHCPTIFQYDEVHFGPLQNIFPKCLGSI